MNEPLTPSTGDPANVSNEASRCVAKCVLSKMPDPRAYEESHLLTTRLAREPGWRCDSIRLVRIFANFGHGIRRCPWAGRPTRTQRLSVRLAVRHIAGVQGSEDQVNAYVYADLADTGWARICRDEVRCLVVS